VCRQEFRHAADVVTACVHRIDTIRAVNVKVNKTGEDGQVAPVKFLNSIGKRLRGRIESSDFAVFYKKRSGHDLIRQDQPSIVNDAPYFCVVLHVVLDKRLRYNQSAMKCPQRRAPRA
jgi:hypothetical protein